MKLEQLKQLLWAEITLMERYSFALQDAMTALKDIALIVTMDTLSTPTLTHASYVE